VFLIDIFSHPCYCRYGLPKVNIGLCGNSRRKGMNGVSCIWNLALQPLCRLDRSRSARRLIFRPTWQISWTDIQLVKSPKSAPQGVAESVQWHLCQYVSTDVIEGCSNFIQHYMVKILAFKRGFWSHGSHATCFHLIFSPPSTVRRLDHHGPRRT